MKHTYVLGLAVGQSGQLRRARVWRCRSDATIDGQYPIKAGLRGLPAGEADSSFPEVAFAGPNAPPEWRGTDARAFTEYLNNLHAAEQPELDPRQTHDDVRAAGAAHGRRRARAHLRQSGDVRLQQPADRGLQCGGYARYRQRQRVRELSARRVERDQHRSKIPWSPPADVFTPTRSGRRTTSRCGPICR